MARGRKKKVKLEVSSATKSSVVSIFFITLSFLSLIGLFQAEFLVGRFIYAVFGYGAFLLPPIFLIMGFVTLRKVEIPFVKLSILFGLIIISFSLSILFEAIMDGGVSGGLVGLVIFKFLESLVSSVGVLIISVSGIVIGLVITLDKGIEGFFTMLKNFILKLRVKKEEKNAEEEAVKEQVMTDERVENENEDTIPVITGEPDNFEVVAQVYGGDEKVAVSKTDSSDNVDRGDFFTVIPSQAEPSSEAGALRQEEVVNKEVKDIKPVKKVKEWQYPTLDLLDTPPNIEADRGDVNARAKIIEKTLGSFGIKSKVVEIHFGPAVTQYALETQEGTKITKINNLHSDLAMSLASPTGTVRIEAPIPGKSLIGIEVPNFKPSVVTLKSILKSEHIKPSDHKLTVSLGRDVSGLPVTANISTMPHALIAGATGSGKSILVHSLIQTLLFRCSPEECKFIMVDPKRVELKKYEGIPHLLTPVIVDPEKALPALKWAVDEMTKRYKRLEQEGSRDIEAYNARSDVEKMPFIVIIVDEFADLMATASNDVEKAVCRIAQMARAVGIHLILSTQRPSVDVLTGLIKANIPTRIALSVSSQTDSRVVIDTVGAEKLLGKGDMLFVPPESSKPKRVQATFVSEQEISRVVDFIKNQGYESGSSEEIVEYGENKIEGLGTFDDDLFPKAVKVVVEENRASASLLQRRLSVGYARAARLLDELEEKGIIGAQEGSRAREVYAKDVGEILGEDYEQDDF